MEVSTYIGALTLKGIYTFEVDKAGRKMQRNEKVREEM